jgi:hypothetical protein
MTNGLHTVKGIAATLPEWGSTGDLVEKYLKLQPNFVPDIDSPQAQSLRYP